MGGKILIVINWFNNTDKKEEIPFIICNTESFYPPVSPDLFRNSIDLVKSIHSIYHNDFKVIMYVRKTVLFRHEEP